MNTRGPVVYAGVNKGSDVYDPLQPLKFLNLNIWVLWSNPLIDK